LGQPLRWGGGTKVSEKRSLKNGAQGWGVSFYVGRLKTDGAPERQTLKKKSSRADAKYSDPKIGKGAFGKWPLQGAEKGKPVDLGLPKFRKGEGNFRQR